MRYLHNRVLHGWGIAQGFEVTAAADSAQIEISPGFAIDREGREIVLEEPLQIDSGAAVIAGEASCFVTVSWEQLPDGFDTASAASFTRWREWPGVAVSCDPLSDCASALLLARLQCSDGTITDVDMTQRRPLGLADA